MNRNSPAPQENRDPGMDATSLSIIRDVKSVFTSHAKKSEYAPSFILCFPSPIGMTMHTERVPGRDLSQAVIALMRMLCESEKNNQNESPEYRRLVAQLEADFLNMIEKFNRSAAKVRAAPGGTPTTQS